MTAPLLEEDCGHPCEPGEVRSYEQCNIPNDVPGATPGRYVMLMMQRVANTEHEWQKCLTRVYTTITDKYIRVEAFYK